MCNPYLCSKPFRLSNINRIPIEAKGVYGIWDKKYCIYIGRTWDQGLRMRLMQHWSDCHNRKLKKWIEVKKQRLDFNFKEFFSEEETKEMEKFYYNLYKPIANIQRL
jgi:hypothetical protein